MSGIYIHIPFCKTKCSYCDFYSKTDFSMKSELVQAILREIEIRKTYLNEHVATIYFGGGTPSTLSIAEITDILNAIFSNFTIEKGAEITLEANPDDLSPKYLSELKKTGINRLSMGIQSFDDKQLKAVNRRHSVETALQAIDYAHKTGFDNISIDLIYGLPWQSLESWKQQIDKATKLAVQHISAYGLTYEEGTSLWRQMKDGKITPADDETMIEMYRYLIEVCEKHGFEQYEISNFAQHGFRSRHNSSYWTQTPYLGVGPAAHSYNGNSRQWNMTSINKYSQNLLTNQPFFEKEELTPHDKYNDYVMVSLRTKEGINFQFLKKLFGEKMYNHCVEAAKKHIDNNNLCIIEPFLRLTSNGLIIADSIISDLMYV